MFSFKLVVFMTISSLQIISSTTVNGGKPVSCFRAEATEVRIQGCQHEPCTLKKGTSLLLEIDLTFEFPKSMKEAALQALLAYWNVPGTGFFGTYLASGNSCSELQLQCPANSGEKYTLKTHLYADPELRNNFPPFHKTGNVTTLVYLQLMDPAFDAPEGLSVCSFNLGLSIVQ